LREQLENYGILSNRAALYWLTRGGDAEGDIMVGWQPLLQALRGARDPFSFDLLHNLNTDASTLDGDLPQGKSTPDIIPKKLWGCILLTDGLNRCPWAAFSTPLGLHITTNLGLAAAFIRSAYLYALHRADQLPIDVISEIQKTFLEPLIKGDPGKLLCLEEEEHVHRLVLLFTDDTQEMVKQRDDPLSVAFNAYLTSPVYTSVVSLINILASAWNIPLNNKEA
jgi:hypothetical protein